MASFLDPDKLEGVSPSEILEAAARGHLGLDHRFLHSLADRPAEALPAVRALAERDRSNDVVDLAPEVLALLRHWKTPDALPFLIAYLKEDPDNVPDELVEALVALGGAAKEPLLKLYSELDEAQSGDVAFVLASLGVRDERIPRILTDRLDYDLSDTLLLLGIYGDPGVIPTLEEVQKSLGSGDAELKKEVTDALHTLRHPPSDDEDGEQAEEYDMWSLYPEIDELPVDLLDPDDRLDLLEHPVPAVRAEVVHSFFNSDLTSDQSARLLDLAKTDPSAEVRARCWESLINSTESPQVLDAMLERLRAPETGPEERSGLLVGLAPEADRNEVRDAFTASYGSPDTRAKALEAMWRSMHPTFRDYFAKHLDDEELEIQRAAIWGVGYYGLKSELERLRAFFDDEELRSDALFAYSLVMPAELSRGRMKGILSRIEKDAKGLSEIEEELVKAALDERLMLAGKEPLFRQLED